jgi:hypothetical protein
LIDLPIERGMASLKDISISRLPQAAGVLSRLGARSNWHLAGLNCRTIRHHSAQPDDGSQKRFKRGSCQNSRGANCAFRDCGRVEQRGPQNHRGSRSADASRLAAMQRADKNISELLNDLQNIFHRLRQSSIDEELFDVISGYEALAADKIQLEPSTRG